MLKAKDMMSKNVLSVKRSTPVLEALKILVENDIMDLPVIKDDASPKLVGIVSDKDFLNMLYGSHNWESETVDSIMTTDPDCIDEDATVREVCDCLRSNVFRRVPVVSKEKLVGIISRSDIVSFMCKRLERVGDLGSFLEQP
ncbi:MAG: CBS domain-containing protein [Phycisphaerales bacterium]|nr:MAG: CBS domain-containing protein [Phycisphaerales bacterium]UCF14768.1 MAG: CBS domain-containing protein [Phycisphaerales bacterium]